VLKTISAFVAMFLVLLPTLSNATDVGGIIYTDTTWDLAGSPYNFTAKIQTADGVTLTIEPGVVLNGNSYNLELRGPLNAIGTETEKISINSIFLIEASIAATVNIQFAVINGGTYYLSQNSPSFSLRDSVIENLSGMTIFDSTNPNDSFIERNVFHNLGNWIRVGKSSGYVHIRNNVFQNAGLMVDGNLGIPAHAVIEYNSFLSTDRIVLYAMNNAMVTAIDNYWNTTNTSVIDSMIFDRNDDIGYQYFVEYTPFLTAPHADTPIPDFNQAPVAKAGADQIVFDTVTLDGSGSYDPDGLIQSYDWNLQHREKASYDRSATGPTPTVSELAPGFYDVVLTVTDNLGVPSTDSMLLAVAGSCFCTANEMHIQSILSETWKGKYGKVAVTVFDNCGNPVPAAQVTGTFSGDFAETGSAVTGASGVAVIYTSATATKPSYTFCVDSVVKGTMLYTSGNNLETCKTK
jgi:hypothetical protein